ncbi:MAG: alanine racemase [Solobacterium sp.]|nr:alanine racemase [Solobacterium sp.]
MYRRTWMEIDLDMISDNIRKLKKICGKRVIAVLKADAYGCGDRYVADAVLRAGADMAAVSSLDEALMLRNEGFACSILILGMTDIRDIPVMIRERISCAAFSKEWVEAAAAEGCKGLKVHLKVDTGMNRIGFRDKDELKKAFETLKDAGAKIEGIFTHFCCADTDMDMTNAQYARFREAVEYLDHPFEWIHCDNSDATAMFKDPLSNACRVGISLYGINTYEKTLQYPISLYTEVIMVKTVHAGETIGYGATYTAQKDELIATCPIGYADGLIRANQGRKVYVEGQYAEIVGRVCMDQVMIRLEKPVSPNAQVEIFGPHISLEKMAEELHTIPYEIICLINARVTRTYVSRGNETEVNTRMIQSRASA